MKKILLILLLLAGVAGVLLLLDRPSADLTMQQKNTDISVDAREMFAEFLRDEAAANEKYLNKIVKVSGEVTTVKTDDRGRIAVTLRGNETNGVKCKLDQRTEHRRREFHVGEQVVFKGVCMGQMADVELVECVEVR